MQMSEKRALVLVYRAEDHAAELQRLAGVLDRWGISGRNPTSCDPPIRENNKPACLIHSVESHSFLCVKTKTSLSCTARRVSSQVWWCIWPLAGMYDGKMWTEADRNENKYATISKPSVSTWYSGLDEFAHGQNQILISICILPSWDLWSSRLSAWMQVVNCVLRIYLPIPERYHLHYFLLLQRLPLYSLL